MYANVCLYIYICLPIKHPSMYLITVFLFVCMCFTLTIVLSLHLTLLPLGLFLVTSFSLPLSFHYHFSTLHVCLRLACKNGLTTGLTSKYTTLTLSHTQIDIRMLCCISDWWAFFWKASETTWCYF